MIQITEAQIHSVNKNTNQELIIKLRIKPEDYTKELEDTLYTESGKKTPMAIVMQEFQGEEVKPLSIGMKRAKLAGLMAKYAEKENTEESYVKDVLYKKYGILSRTELTEDELDEEIKSYSCGLSYDVN